MKISIRTPRFGRALRVRQYFQSLELFEKKVPIIGTFSWRHFQKVPIIGTFSWRHFQKVPIIGTFQNKSSNHWNFSVGRFSLPAISPKGIRTLAALFLCTFFVMTASPALAVDITWAGLEYTSLTATNKVGDTADFEIQTYPSDIDGNGADLELDWWFNGSWSANATYSMRTNGVSGDNQKWWKTQRMLYAGDHARKYRAFSPDIYVPSSAQWTFTILDLPGPTSCLATNTGGAESMSGSWVKDADYNVMVVRRLGALPDAPVAETSYTQGDRYGASDRNVVVYATGSDATFSDMELLPESTYYYAFYSVNNGCFASNRGTVAVSGSISATTAAFLTNRVASDSFSYFTGKSLNGLTNGYGWASAWSSTGGFATYSESFSDWNGFPANHGNKIRINPANDTTFTAYRTFAPRTSGKLYCSYIMNYEFGGPGKFVGMSFMSNTTERAFFGEISNEDQKLGLSTYDDGGSYVDSGVALTAGSGNNYLIIGMFDFSTFEFKVQAYSTSETVPTTEPTSWDAAVTLAADRMLSIDGIRIGVGEVDSGTSGTVGNTYLDEFHVAASWADLVNDSAPVESTRRAPPPIFFIQGIR